MITGPSLGGSWLGVYSGVGATVDEPETPYVGEGPQGATGPGGPAAPGWGGRYKGSRQRVVDGQFLDDDAVLEEVGGPPKRELPFEPPKPWTPESDVEQPKPAEVPTGQAGLGVTAPTPRPTLPILERPKRIRKTAPTDDDAVAVLLLIIGATWQ